MILPARWTATLMITALAVSGCAVTPGPGSPMTARAAAPAEVLLRIGDRVATATLSDTPESRQFAAMLPATVDLKDVWAQAKSGRLPATITAAGSRPVHDPAAGGIYFWPTTDVLAIYYADLGQAVPAPGLIRLGSVGSGLSGLENAGRQATVRIELAAAAW
jgi:hypothetical protein